MKIISLLIKTDGLIFDAAKRYNEYHFLSAEIAYIIVAIIGSTFFLMNFSKYKKEIKKEKLNAKCKYKSSVMTESLSKELRDSLSRIMNEQKPYLDNELRLDTLADLLGASRNNTSQVINEHFNCCFFDFINKYRIDEAAKLIIDNTITSGNLTITEISYSCGFNNRTSFYMAFKKFKGHTPGVYQNLNKAF